MTTVFADNFFSLSMHQLFNKAVSRSFGREDEAPLIRMLRFAGQI
jgi:hypothetical protein